VILVESADRSLGYLRVDKVRVLMADSSDRKTQLRAKVVALAQTRDAHIFAGKDFRHDSVGARTVSWRMLFEDIRETTSRALEIGSQEGWSCGVLA
jgi:hypothetical protein